MEIGYYEPLLTHKTIKEPRTVLMANCDVQTQICFRTIHEMKEKLKIDLERNYERELFSKQEIGFINKMKKAPNVTSYLGCNPEDQNSASIKKIYRKGTKVGFAELGTDALGFEDLLVQESPKDKQSSDKQINASFKINDVYEKADQYMTIDDLEELAKDLRLTATEDARKKDKECKRKEEEASRMLEMNMVYAPKNLQEN